MTAVVATETTSTIAIATSAVMPVADAPSWDFRNDQFTTSADPPATASAWRDGGRWRYMYADIDAAGDVTGAGTPTPLPADRPTS